MKQQKGFTLVELIIVILILGILAVTAAPRFLSFGTEARVGTLEGVQASVRGAAELTYGKATIRGIERLGLNDDGDAFRTADGIEVYFGYPAASAVGIQAVLNLSSGDWMFFFDANDETATKARIAPTYTITASSADFVAPGTPDPIDDFDNLIDCYVEYTMAVNEDTPYTVTVVGSEC